jgi:lipase chaperone LimK
MWGFDDTYDDDAVARWEIMQDTKLTPDEKRAKLAALDAKMPPELRKEREAPHVVAKEEDKARQMRAAGASEDDIYRMRAATFSPEAAARMAAVDQENADWKTRIADYLDARGQVLNNTSLSDADKQSAVQQLRDAKFSANEQKRLGAYE